MHRPLSLITAGSVAAVGGLIIATALPAAAATSVRAETTALTAPCVPATGGACADTPVTFTVSTTGVLAITAPTTTQDLGSTHPGVVTGTTGAPVGSAGNFGTVTVTDNRGVNPASWTATVSSTSFTNTVTSADVIPVADATYLTGTVSPTVTTPANSTATSIHGTSPLTLTGAAVSVVTESNFDGDNAATWTPEIDVAVPATAVVGIYDGTVTHSVS